jgi:hypothetical protein
MGLADWADSLADEAARARERAAGLLHGTLRLGVTGLSGAGKTVFITGLVAGLLARSRMHLLQAEAEGRIEAALLSPQPDPAVPRFAYESHLAALTGDAARWPESTRSISQLRLSLRYRPAGFRGTLTGSTVLNLDIVDYPGEWLMDLALMERDYDTWSREALALAESPARAPHAEAWRRALAAVDPAQDFAEPAAQALASAYAGYLGACRAAGLSALAPGRFLMPGEMAGSPALTFAPLPKPARAGRESLHAEMRARYDAYRHHVVRPFFRDHFARLDRQVVLVDALGALAAGPDALSDMTRGLAETLVAFRHGTNSWLDRLIGPRRIDRLLFAASKADHLHHSQHPRLVAVVEAMLAEAANRAAYRGGEIRAMAVAAIRATVEQEVARRGETVRLVRGRRMEDGKETAIFPGELPESPQALLAAAGPEGGGAAAWPDAGYATVRFAPPRWLPRPGEGPPHIRLDQALDFLIGDRLE